MTLRARIWTLLIVAVLLVLGAGVALRQGYRTVAAASDTVTNTLQPAAASMAALDNAIAAMDSGVTSYAITSRTDDLAVYVGGSARADDELGKLETLTAYNKVLSARLGQTEDALRTWRKDGLQPIIVAARDDQPARAAQLVADGPSRGLLNELKAYEVSLNQLILSEAQVAVEQQERAFTRFWWVLNGAVLVLLAVIALFAWLLLRGVLRPLEFLGQQMLDAAATDHHEDPITPTGPPELREVGQDAESMRRELVAQIDRSRQADEGLEQERPVLAAIRAELCKTHVRPTPGLDLFGEQMPAEGVMAGDWWSAQTLPDGRVAIAVTDVSGHGPGAAIEALRLKNVMELSLAQHADPARALRLGAEGMSGSDRFATCVIVVLDPATGSMRWSNAGHPAPLAVGAHGVTALEADGPLLSVLGGEWTNRSEELAIGDVLLLTTDGLTESRDADGAELGDSGLRDLAVRATATEPDCDGVVGYVLSAARARARDWNRDDITCIAIRRTGR